jgi:hypothetical protein
MAALKPEDLLSTRVNIPAAAVATLARVLDLRKTGLVDRLAALPPTGLPSKFDKKRVLAAHLGGPS